MSQTATDQGWKKPRVLEFVFKFFVFLGFNVHNAEHRYDI